MTMRIAILLFYYDLDSLPLDVLVSEKALVDDLLHSWEQRAIITRAYGCES